MDERDFEPFRLAQVFDSEVDAADSEEEAIFRSFIMSEAGEKIALELSLAQLREFVHIAGEFLKGLAGGSRPN